jgi:hypothetical protein
MAALNRLRRDSADDEVPGEDDELEAAEAVAVMAAEGAVPEDRTEEEALRSRLSDDPNDVEAFDRLAQIVRARAAEGHEAGDPQRAAGDAVWALAEEVARNGRAWYPLIELARLSIEDDREVALRRLSTAAERDPSGIALAQGLQTLRDAGHEVDALNLGVGHWRPREHVVEVARQLVEAAIAAERYGEAKRHLDALDAHPDRPAADALRADLGARLAAARGGNPRPPADQGFEDAGPTAGSRGPSGEGRDDKGKGGLLGFLRR